MRRTLCVMAGILATGAAPHIATAQETAAASDAVPLEGVVVTTSKVPKKAVDQPSASSSVGSSGGARRRAPAAAQAAAAAAAVPSEPFPQSGVPADGFGANGKSQFDKIQPGSVTDIVRDMPGVTTSVSATDPTQSVNIRGLQDFGRVNVMVDGARQNFQRSGHNANGSFYLDPEFISSLDVTRGPSANAYGSGAIGGVAAFNTRGIDDIMRVEEQSAIVQKTGFGTNGAGLLTSTSGGLRIGRNVDVFGQFIKRDTSPYDDGDGIEVPDSGFDNYGGLGKVRVRPFAGAEITATALLQEYDFVNSVTTAAGPGRFVTTRRDSNASTETYTLGYTFARPDTPLIDFSSKIYYTSTDLDQVRLPLTTPPRDRGFEIETAGFDVFNTSRFQTASLGHRLTYGVDGFEDRVAVFDNELATAQLFTPTGERRVWGTFIEDEVTISQWLKVIGGLRYDAYELEGGGEGSDGERVSPKGTVAVTPVKGIEFFGTYAEGYRAPALTETIIAGRHPNFGPGSDFVFLPNPTLDAEVGQTKELGVNLKYDNIFKRGDRFRGKFAAFRNDIEDYIDLSFVPPVPALGCIAAPGDPPVPFCLQYANIAEARIEGFELELGYDWGGGFLNIAGTLTSTENRDTGIALLSHQPDRLSTTLGFRFLDDKLIAGTRVHLVEGSEADAVRSVPPQLGQLITVFAPTDGYVLWDLFGSYQFNDWSALDVALNNITDVDYRKYLDQNDSAGFQARAALTVKFGGGNGPWSNW